MVTLPRMAKRPLQRRLQAGQFLVNGALFLAHACKLGLEGTVSKRLDKPYMPGNRGVWVKAKCLNREEFARGKARKR
jgi:bifunctional non-homologous end joining protein LigD